jgi:ribulose-phosphate 3-epimerase
MKVAIAPSILSADFSKLGEEIRAVEAAGADIIHIDVMDGHFVPNITIGPAVVGAARAVTRLPLDVHLMIERPEAFAGAFADVGADIITIHVETGYHHMRTLSLIRSLGKKAGIALNPGTPLEAVTELLPETDLLLVMTVNPGFGGQAYIPSMTKKIEAARLMLDAAGSGAALEVDGGVKAENAHVPAQAGATILVMGSGLFETGDYAATMAEVRRGLQWR